MQILFVSVLLLVCLCPFLCGAQQSCNLRNCSRTQVEICTTNGRECRRFSNECSLVSANCNATLSTAWNRTDTTLCLNLRANTTGVCFCPELRNCTNQPTASGICTHSDGHTCRLFRTECDLVRARCNREGWRNIDIMQCSGFSPNQTRPCICPKSLVCSRNATRLCVQDNENNCRLFGNECDLEGARCRGQRLRDVNNLHCQSFEVGDNGTCTCPELLGCQQNVTNICVKNAANGCQLMRNQCDLERERCSGTVLNTTLAIQCSNLRPGQTGNCACPSLDTCSLNRTNICVRTRVGCRLKTNECELERARCQGEVATPISSLQCRGLAPGAGGPCACPRLESCQQNVTNICVRSAEGCVLMGNECDLERARCEGRNFTVVNNIHCSNFTANQLSNCSCPNIDNCTASSPSICVSSSATQCRLMVNRCELEMARCRGEALTITNPLQCRGLSPNITSDCRCPRLIGCSRNTTNICVSENNNNGTCSLIRNECELEQAVCEGRNVTRLNSIHCRNFTSEAPRICVCPNLMNCNRNSSSICVRSSNQCRLMSNECELEQSRCEGNSSLTRTQPLQCLNFEMNQQRNCSCPNLLSCSRNSTRICIRTRTGCQLLTTECEAEAARCRGEALRTVDLMHCQGFRNQEHRSCFCPNLETCARNSSRICVRNPRNNCILLRNQCELEQARCQGQTLSIVPDRHCLNFTLNASRTCLCSNLLNCSTAADSKCVQLATGCKLLRNQCELENEKCQGTVHRILPASQCKLLQPGTAGHCACPKLLHCQGSSSEICVETFRGCMLLRNQCELELMRCQREALQLTHPLQCRGFRLGELRKCACPKMKTCARRRLRNICVRNIQNSCRLMGDNCDLEEARCRGQAWRNTPPANCCGFATNELRSCATSMTERTCAKHIVNGRCHLFRTRCAFNRANSGRTVWSVVDQTQCKCLQAGNSGTCAQRIVCRRPGRRTRRVCGRLGQKRRQFRSQCHLRLHNYEKCTNFVPVRRRECRRRG